MSYKHMNTDKNSDKHNSATTSDIVATIIAYMIEITQIAIGVAFFAFVLMFAYKMAGGGV